MRCLKPPLSLLLAGSLLAATASCGTATPPGAGARSPARPTPTKATTRSAATAPAATAPFTVGTLRVRRYGDRGPAVILIPGLSAGPWEWRGTIAHFDRDHVIYSLTLAGFDGRPAPAKKRGLMDMADASLLKLIRTRHIDKPVLVGHSLGGTLAIRFASEHPQLLAGVLAVEGLPVFPMMTASQRSAVAQQIRTQIGHVTPAAYKTQELSYMRHIGVVKQAKHWAALSARSDPDAMLEYAAEDLETDLGPQLKRITVPVLEISPYYKPDSERAARMSKHSLTTAKKKADYYRKLLKGAPNARVVSITGARHFAMLDQPQKFYAVMTRFLANLKSR